MTRFELQTSGVGSNRSTKWAPATAIHKNNCSVIFYLQAISGLRLVYFICFKTQNNF